MTKFLDVVNAKTVISIIDSGSKVRYNDKNLTPGQKYYYRLVTYSQSHGKTYCGPQTADIGATVRG